MATLPLALAHCATQSPEPDPGASTQSETGTTAAQGSGSASDADGSGTTSSVATGDSGADTAQDTADPGLSPSALFMSEISGLWAGPVTSGTSAGNFPTMNMDVRAADDRTLFARCDLDESNSLRFSFAVETHNGEDVLVYRNGGYFQGVLRDNRTTLVEHDAQANLWRFCATRGGCAYIDAAFSFPQADTVALDVEVLGLFHIEWTGTRIEPRELEGPFPYDDNAGDPSDPFPEMPSLTTTVSWNTPTQGAGTVWVILTTEACGVSPVGCTPSRFIQVSVPEGATSAALVMDQIHPGMYFGFAVVDRNDNLSATLAPDSGDSVSIPDQMVVVDALGRSSASIAVVFDLP